MGDRLLDTLPTDEKAKTLQQSLAEITSLEATATFKFLSLSAQGKLKSVKEKVASLNSSICLDPSKVPNEPFMNTVPA